MEGAQGPRGWGKAEVAAPRSPSPGTFRAHPGWALAVSLGVRRGPGPRAEGWAPV